MSVRGKVGEVQCHPEFFQLLLQFIDVLLCCVSGILFFKEFRTFSLGFSSSELPGNLKHGWMDVWLLRNFVTIFES